MILGWRKESYTLIPQKTGSLVLPAIKVQWWDISNNKTAIAELPERMINVLPAVAGQNPPPTIAPTTGRSVSENLFNGANVFSNLGSLLLYGLIAAAGATFLFAAFLGRGARHRKRRQETNNPSLSVPVKWRRRKSAPGAIANGELKRVRTVKELQSFLRSYAHARSGISKNVSLDRSIFALSSSWTASEIADVDAVIKGIDTALYAGGATEVEDLKIRCSRIITALNRKAKNGRNGAGKLQSLNLG
jgi:hypothetical protein